MTQQMGESGPSAQKDSISIYQAVHQAHAALSSLSTRPPITTSYSTSSTGIISSQLHLLNSKTARVISTPDSDPSDPRRPPSYLARKDFRRLLSQIKSTASGLKGSSPALNRKPGASNDPFKPSASDDEIKRYISLLGETSDHIASLVQSIHSVTSQQIEPALFSSSFLPACLHAGILSSETRKKPTLDQPIALSTLDALCHAVQSLAQDLKLETFSEKATEGGPPGAEMHTHTLTLGGRILVIDIEILLRSEQAEAKTLYAPLIKLKISYASDSSGEGGTRPRPPQRDPRLGQLMENNVQALSQSLFGMKHDLDPADAASPDQVSAHHYEALRSNLSFLVKLDDLSFRSDSNSSSSPGVDLFASMQSLAAAVCQVSELERKASEGRGDEQQVLFSKGHGIARLHEEKPFLSVLYYSNGDPSTAKMTTRSPSGYSLNMHVEPVSKAQELLSPESSKKQLDQIPRPSWLLSKEADSFIRQHFQSTAFDLGTVPALLKIEGAESIPLRYVAYLSPPVVLPRKTAAKLAQICGLPASQVTATCVTLPVLETGLPSCDDAVWFEEALVSCWKRYATNKKVEEGKEEGAGKNVRFVISKTPPSLRGPESQGLVVDRLPFLPLGGPNQNQSLATLMERLFAAIEILRDQVSITELLRDAVGADLWSSDQDGDDLTSLVGLMGEDVNGDKEAINLEDLLEDASSGGDDDDGQDGKTIIVTYRFQHATDDPQATASTSSAGRGGPVLELGFRADKETMVTLRVARDPDLDLGWEISARSHHPSNSVNQAPHPPLEPKSPQAASIVSQSLLVSGGDSGTKSNPSLRRLVELVAEFFSPPSDPRGRGGDEGTKVEARFDPLEYERRNVHEVYETIASHFSSTRYKPWPLVPLFLSTIPSGSIGADLGCGNGKYLSIRSVLDEASKATSRKSTGPDGAEGEPERGLLTFGLDRSSNLVSLAQTNFGLVATGNTEKGKAKGKGEEKGSGGRKKRKNKEGKVDKDGHADLDAKIEALSLVDEGLKPDVEDGSVQCHRRDEDTEMIPAKKLNEVAVGDALASGYRSGVFDYAISIATIHHFSTWERRKLAVQELIRILQPVEPKGSDTTGSAAPPRQDQGEDGRMEGGQGKGRFMIFAWALEQRDEGKRVFEGIKPGSGGRAGEDAVTAIEEKLEGEKGRRAKDAERLVSDSGLSRELSKACQEERERKEEEEEEKRRRKGESGEGTQGLEDEQDVLVPWVLTKPSEDKKRKGKKKGGQGSDATGSEVDGNAEEKHGGGGSSGEGKVDEEKPPVFQRYYHVFRSGELEELVEEAGRSMPPLAGRDLRVVKEAGGWERGNWWGVWRVEFASRV